MLSDASLQTAGILFITIPTIEFGGLSLFRYLANRVPGYMDNPVRRGMFTAGHAHAGVLVLLALLALVFVDSANLSGGMRQAVRSSVAGAAILMPAGFFLSIVKPTQTTPNRLVLLIFTGAAALAFGTLTLGVGLVRA